MSRIPGVDPEETQGYDAAVSSAAGVSVDKILAPEERLEQVQPGAAHRLPGALVSRMMLR
jgi:hypothetical protein